MPTVAVLGTGVMGAPMARRLAAAGHDVRAWNRTAARIPRDLERAASPAEAVAGADVVLTMLADGPAVEKVLAEAAPPAGTLWLQMSTVGVAAVERLLRIAAERGLLLVDAPVMGSKGHAESGELAVLAACVAGARPAAEELFEPLARRVLWLDRPGDGSRLKIVLNGWILSVVESLAEALALARELGLDGRRFFDGIEGMAFDMAYAHQKGGLMLAGEFPTAFPLRLAAKDLGLGVEAASALDLPVLRATRDQYLRALELGAGDEDSAAVARVTGAGG